MLAVVYICCLCKNLGAITLYCLLVVCSVYELGQFINRKRLITEKFASD
jgi:hypothetical protein